MLHFICGTNNLNDPKTLSAFAFMQQTSRVVQYMFRNYPLVHFGNGAFQLAKCVRRCHNTIRKHRNTLPSYKTRTHIHSQHKVDHVA